MREWCSCGSSIRARRADVIAWRSTHRHEPDKDPEPDKDGATAQVEHAGRRYFETEASPYGGVDMPIVQARIGFTPNG